jgi:DNA-directed RNA polymerase subunit RPC12/RpoP
MKNDYHCARCKQCFAVDISPEEQQTRLAPERQDGCPSCGQRVGMGPVTCGQCGQVFDVALPHWHVNCDCASGTCPGCKTRYVSLCIC